MISWLDSTKTTEEIAKELLGMLVVKETPNGRTSGWIVETEAYLGELDAAAHSFAGKRTPRLESMYEKAGTIYVYSMHTHQMLNLVVQKKDIPEAILIRALEPYEGISLMEERRQQTGISLTDGPGKLTKAFAIDKTDDGTWACTPPLVITMDERRYPKKIDSSKRIGIPNKGEWTDALLRYSVKGNPYVSRIKGKKELDHGWIEN
ncbi:DNA-3-methyladenine glycosylase [Carnobacterium gallinarum]|uniref:DNA-3-methyladenine glycosylase n=1 Tax=Carnobacterium gallinarum TaxID=2749 RepID=UPI000550CFD2|nr:DNA-3-methyladenine glycosylase [Carnobacterium gallinarum]